MRKIIGKIRARLTRRNVLWFLKTNVQSWIIQGSIIGALTVCGVGTLAAAVSAKTAAYVVFAAQCVKAARSTPAE